MAKLCGIVICLSIIMLCSGCAGPYMAGGIYSEFSAPYSWPSDETGLVVGSKTGTAEMMNILGLAATGDASIDLAAKNGGIKRIKTVNYKFYNLLGIVQRTTTIVTGE